MRKLHYRRIYLLSFLIMFFLVAMLIVLVSRIVP